MKEAIHVIYIMTFSPKYEFYKDENEIINSTIHHWKNQEEKAIGIWIEDWAHKLGFKLLENYSNLKFEVWRPDERAEKEYMHVFKNGLIHKSFPITHLPIWSGIKKTKGIYSPSMETSLMKYLNEKKENEDILLFLPISQKPISTVIQKKFSEKIPILNTHFLYCKGLLGKLVFKLNPVRCLHENIKAMQQKNNMKQIKNLMVAHKKYIPELKKTYKCNVFFNTVGTNLEFWKHSIPNDKAKENLDLKHKGHIFLFSSRLVPEYQIDEVLKVITKLKKQKFLCIFTSHGPTKYVTLLKTLVKKYNIKDKVRFTGFVDESTLKLLYCACDTFFMTSIINAGPLSTFYALLLEKPVITTTAGLAAEILEENNCGLLVSPKNYNQWYEAMNFAINDGKIKKLNRDIVTNIFDWDNVSLKWMNIFEKSITSFKTTKCHCKWRMQSRV